jgi:hypothetical protein
MTGAALAAALFCPKGEFGAIMENIENSQDSESGGEELRVPQPDDWDGESDLLGWLQGVDEDAAGIFADVAMIHENALRLLCSNKIGKKSGEDNAYYVIQHKSSFRELIEKKRGLQRGDE